MAESMQWAITLPDGEQVPLWDLDMKLLARLADELGEAWTTLVDSPLSGSGKMALVLYAAVCKSRGQTPAADLTVRGTLALFEVIPDDKPTVYEDGLPAPKADGPTTD